MDKTTNAIMATLFLSGVAPEAEYAGDRDASGSPTPARAIPEIRALFARTESEPEGQSAGPEYPAAVRKAYC